MFRRNASLDSDTKRGDLTLKGLSQTVVCVLNRTNHASWWYTQLAELIDRSSLAIRDTLFGISESRIVYSTSSFIDIFRTFLDYFHHFHNSRIPEAQPLCSWRPHGLSHCAVAAIQGDTNSRDLATRHCHSNLHPSPQGSGPRRFSVR